MDIIISNKKTIANKFNVYFTTFGKRIANEIRSDINSLSYIDFKKFHTSLLKK